MSVHPGEVTPWIAANRGLSSTIFLTMNDTLRRSRKAVREYVGIDWRKRDEMAVTLCTTKCVRSGMLFYSVSVTLSDWFPLY